MACAYGFLACAMSLWFRLLFLKTVHAFICSSTVLLTVVVFILRQVSKFMGFILKFKENGT
jgi:hypothetical protein